MEAPIGVKTFQGTLFCPECGSKMVLDYLQETLEPVPGKPYLKRQYYMKCPATNCPRQNVHVELPDA